MLSLPNYIGLKLLKVKEGPDPGGQSTIRSRASEAWIQLIAANMQNGFGENEEDKNVFFMSDSYQEK